MITGLQFIIIVAIVCALGTGVLAVMFLAGFIPVLRKWWNDRKPAAEPITFSADEMDFVVELHNKIKAELSATKETLKAVTKQKYEHRTLWLDTVDHLELAKEVAVDLLAERDARIEWLEKDYITNANYTAELLTDAQETIALLQEALAEIHGEPIRWQPMHGCISCFCDYEE